MRRLFYSFLLACLAALNVCATQPFIVFQASEGALSLENPTIGITDGEQPCVKRAVQSLCEDFRRVTGRAAVAGQSYAFGDRGLGYASSPQDAPTIIVGTVGANSQIDRWVKQGELRDLKGKTEKYIIKTIGRQLVIAGSDKRGTVFGIYELSRQMGVSPWYWWADVPVEHHERLFVLPGEYTDGEPQVRYRGIFLNDEAPCLTSWVKNTWGTNYGDHRFYEHVFELILRLKGNFLWPAMWSWAFYADDPENSRTADEMGIIIGTSHHEPMARNHQEWARHRSDFGAWNYQTNQKVLDRFFREGIERMKGTDDIVTIGMRGDGDEAMSDEADTRLLERIVGNQRRIIREVTGRPAKETPQVWALYKEVLDYYDQGMRVPDDVIMLLCDDNWGNIRRVPVTEKERRHPGGWGIYYHVDYVGAPRNSKFINVPQTQQMAEQLSLAYDYGIDRMWILNVGDLKPMEYPIQLFLDMAWAPKAHSPQTITAHTRSFFRSVLGGSSSVFGDSVAEIISAEAAAIYNQNCQYMARVTPEMLDARTYDLASGEWRCVADDYQRLEARALRLFLQLPESYRDAYRQLILFPVQVMANLYDMYFAQAMNLRLAASDDPDANLWADRVADCFRRDSLLCAEYNNDIAGGKWRGMMTQKHIGYTSWNDNFPHEMMPETVRVGQRATELEQGGYTFLTDSRGYVAMEAEHYHRATAEEGTQWTVYPWYGRTRSAVALTPYTTPVGNATITYRFTLPQEAPATVKVHVVVKSTLDFLNVGGHEYAVSLDGSEPKVVNFNQKLIDREPYTYSDYYPTVARRVVESVVELPVGVSLPCDESQGTPSSQGTSSLHELTLHPRHPGIVFEKIVIDYGGYQAQYLFGQETPCRRN